MSDFKAKCTRFAFPGLRPDRADWGAYSAPSDLLAVFKGFTSKERDENGKGEEDEGGRTSRADEVEGVGIWPTETFWRGAPYGLEPRKALIRPMPTILSSANLKL